MINTEALKSLIESNGLKIKYVAEKIGLTYQGFKNKLENKSEFTVTEVNKLCKLLNITDLTVKERIFFANRVDL